jgi:heparanase
VEGVRLFAPAVRTGISPYHSKTSHDPESFVRETQMLLTKLNAALSCVGGAVMMGITVGSAWTQSADSPRAAIVVKPAAMPKREPVDARFVSYNVEMVEVTGGRFWAPYRSESAAPPRQAEATSMPGLDPKAFRMRPPIDLANARLRSLAKALGPAYMRVSGTWANSTYFHDADTPAPERPPDGFGGVLTRAQWRGVVEFAKATDAAIVTSFAISPGVRDASGVWTPVQAQKLLAYTASIGSRIAAAELFNEPNLSAIGGAPKGYDAAAYGRDFGVFLPFIRRAAPGLLVLGPGSVGEGGLLANYAGIKSEAMLTAAGSAVGVDVFSYHSYNGVSQRCAGRGGAGTPVEQTTPDAALTADWLSRTERDARFYGALRDRFAAGKPLWLTESGETACGGNPWASSFTDTFRYIEQLGRLAKLGVRVVMHNTLAASDYALIDEETLDPRPSYWAALLWRRLMGTGVLDAGASAAPGVDVFAHCLAGTSGGVALVAVNTDRSTSRAMTVPASAERYTLTSSTGLLSHHVQLNGRDLALEKNGAVPALRGIQTSGGGIDLPPASITFLAIPAAANPGCKSTR